MASESLDAQDLVHLVDRAVDPLRTCAAHCFAELPLGSKVHVVGQPANSTASVFATEYGLARERDFALEGLDELVAHLDSSGLRLVE